MGAPLQTGLRTTAATHSDALLCLDDIAQLSGKEAGEVGSAKCRWRRDG
jgi:hypothetical protein